MTACKLFKRHIWQKYGLDVRHDRLVRVRRCACGAYKTISYETGSSLVPTVLTLATLAGILAVAAAILWPLLHGLVNALPV